MIGASQPTPQPRPKSRHETHTDNHRSNSPRPYAHSKPPRAATHPTAGPAILRRGSHHALAHYVLLELEQALQRTNRPRAAMIQKVCDRLEVPCTVAGVREVLTKTKTP